MDPQIKYSELRYHSILEETLSQTPSGCLQTLWAGELQALNLIWHAKIPKTQDGSNGRYGVKKIKLPAGGR